MDAVPVKVFAKVRAVQQREQVFSSLQIRQRSVYTRQHSCEFSQVFYGDDGPQHVLDHTDMKRLVNSCLDGYNSCLLLLGETGSGKNDFLAGNSHQGSESLFSALSTALFSRMQPTNQGQQSGSIRGYPEFRVALRGFEVAGTAVRDLTSSHQLSLNAFGFPGADVKDLSGQTVGNPSEAVAHFQQMWSRRTLSHQDIGQTHPLSTLVIVFDIDCKQPGLAGPVRSWFTIVCLPGVEQLPEPDHSVRQQTTRSPSASVSSVRTLGHYILQLSRNDDSPRDILFHPMDTPLKLIMGNYLSANCVTNALVTLKPTVEGAAVDKVLLYASRLGQIVNYPIVNSSATSQMLQAVERRSRALYEMKDGGERNVPTRLSDVSSGIPIEEQLQTLVAANHALKAENTQLKLQSLITTSHQRRDQSGGIVSGNALSQTLIPQESTPICSRHQQQETGWYDSESLTMILDREHVMSRELERLKSSLDTLESEKKQMAKENGDLKLQVLSLTGREESLLSDLRQLKGRFLQLQGKVRENESSSFNYQTQEQGRAALSDVQLSKVRQEFNAVKQDLRKAEKYNKDLHAQLKQLNADYRQRLEQYIHDVTAYLKDNRSVMLTGKFPCVVLELIDDITRRYVENCNQDIQHSRDCLQMVQEREAVLVKDISLLSSYIDGICGTLGRSTDVTLSDELLSKLSQPPPIRSRGQLNCTYFPKCPPKARLGHEVLQTVNKVIPTMLVSMETVPPAIEADFCKLLEQFLELKLSLLKFSVEGEERAARRNKVNSSDPLLQGVKEQLKDVQREKVALMVKSEMLEAKVKELKKLFDIP